MAVRILRGDCREMLRSLPEQSVHMAVTSPPYYGLRDYQIEPTVWGGDQACPHTWTKKSSSRDVTSGNGRGSSTLSGGRSTYEGMPKHSVINSVFCPRCGAWRGVLGLEPTYQMFVANMVEVFREVRRVLRNDGTLWLNLGDSYATGAGAVGSRPGGGEQGDRWAGVEARGHRGQHLPKQAGKQSKRVETMGPITQPNRMPQPGLKPKDLMGIPWRVAFALQDDGWWLRQDIIWKKENPMPESTSDRCTKSHEYVFLLSKCETYFYDNEAIKEPATQDERRPSFRGGAYVGGASFLNSGDGGKSTDIGNVRVGRASGNKTHKGVSEYERSDSEEHLTKANLLAISETAYGTRNKRSVWSVATEPFPEAHFATFPTKLIEPTILAGTSERGCCRSCMAGWQRVVEKVDTGKRQKMADGWDTGEGGHGAFHRNGREKGESGVPVMTNQTVGWYPACGCAGIEPLPKYPQKPSEDDFEGDVPAFDAEVQRWNAACEILRQARSRLCELVAPIKTAPALVLDPFGGAGTTGLVADRLQRDAILCELKPEYADMAARRIEGDGGLFSRVAAE